MSPHTPVLLAEVVELLNVSPDQTYLDATVGSGGHAQGILAAGGSIIGLDQDPVALSLAKSRLDPARSLLECANFSRVTDVLTARGIHHLAGAVFDLGVSSMQLDDPARGFSFLKANPLDMRMSPELSVTARDLVNALGKMELERLFKLYGDEPRAFRIAQAIVEQRQKQPFFTTLELAEVITRVYGGRQGKLHPATKVFQALRIAVNDELNALKSALPQVMALLNPQARLLVISFHEGEDRIVKQFSRRLAEQNLARPLTKKPMRPTEAEVLRNPRARSAKLRVMEKL